MSCSQVTRCLNPMTGARPPEADCKPGVTPTASLPVGHAISKGQCWEDLVQYCMPGDAFAIFSFVYLLTPDGMNRAEFYVFAMKRNIERRCTVGLEKFTKSSGYGSAEHVAGTDCQRAKIKYFLLFSVWG